MTDQRNALAKARDEFFKSHPKLFDAETLKDGAIGLRGQTYYLKKRIEHAFLDGWCACESEQNRLGAGK